VTEVLAAARDLRSKGQAVEAFRRSGKFGAQLTRLESAGFTAFIHIRNDNGVIARSGTRRSTGQTDLHNAQLMHSVTAVSRLAQVAAQGQGNRVHLHPQRD
jgi:hypothetical protein